MEGQKGRSMNRNRLLAAALKRRLMGSRRFLCFIYDKSYFAEEAFLHTIRWFHGYKILYRN